jgi:hypothetical protein
MPHMERVRFTAYIFLTGGLLADSVADLDQDLRLFLVVLNSFGLRGLTEPSFRKPCVAKRLCVAG